MNSTARQHLYEPPVLFLNSKTGQIAALFTYMTFHSDPYCLPLQGPSIWERAKYREKKKNRKRCQEAEEAETRIKERRSVS